MYILIITDIWYRVIRCRRKGCQLWTLVGSQPCRTVSPLCSDTLTTGHVSCPRTAPKPSFASLLIWGSHWLKPYVWFEIPMSDLRSSFTKLHMYWLKGCCLCFTCESLFVNQATWVVLHHLFVSFTSMTFWRPGETLKTMQRSFINIHKMRSCHPTQHQWRVQVNISVVASHPTLGPNSAGFYNVHWLLLEQNHHILDI